MPSSGDHARAAQAHSAPVVFVPAPPVEGAAGGDIRLEKNLASLGFFTPSSKRIKLAKAKTVVFARTAGERRSEASATIVPAALYGLPVTSDQDKYLALQKIVTDIKIKRGQVRNPVGFTSAQMLALLGAHPHSGRNYAEVAEWLDLMTATTVISEEAVYFAGRRKFARDRFHVFERAVSVGEQIEPGRVADRNYVWFSEWQLENLNSDYVIPVDFDSYRALRNNIAKTLLPLLQIWLFASRAEGRFEKRYDELCQLLDVRRYEHRSKIVEKLGPSLDELRAHGYLAGWAVESTSDKQAFKVILRHGARFGGGQKAPRTSAGPPSAQRVAPSASAPVTQENRPRTDGDGCPEEVDVRLLSCLTMRGVGVQKARQLLSRVGAGQSVRLQLAWGDHLIAQAPAGTYRNPPGFYVHLVENDVSPPPDFSRAFATRAGDNSASPSPASEAETGGQRITNVTAGEAELDRKIEALGVDERLRLVDEVRAAFFAAHPYVEDWPPEVLDRVLAGALRSAVAG